MIADTIREALKAQPFRTFTMRTAGGREYRIDHPELAAVSPGGRVLVVFTSADGAVTIDTLLIESMHFENGRENGRGRKR
ncbi:MAG TPA: hypothetical protein PLU35_01045 [Phycisphaerales bacterium]|nr:hypothetical protein [Phycisphaerales bacterium]